MYSGELEGLKNTESITGEYLFEKNKAEFTRKEPSGSIPIKNANIHNLKNVSVDIPKSVLTCITGIAGSGKSSLINHWLLKNHPEAIVIDQSPVGRSSRGNPATYTGVFTPIRELFAHTPEAKIRGYKHRIIGRSHLFGSRFYKHL